MENALQDNRAGNIKFQVLSSFTLVTNNNGLCFEVKRRFRTSNSNLIKVGATERKITLV